MKCLNRSLLVSLMLSITPVDAQQYRSRHVQEEWNTRAYNLQEGINFSGNCWHHLDWFGTYYQTQDWWIYHCEKGWLYPESDSSCGVYLYWDKIGNWIWTKRDVYPWAWNYETESWFNFCAP